MAPRPRWWRILEESRRQACVAVDFYNKSGADRSYLDFVVHMHLAWQYLLHAECEKVKQDYRYRDARGHLVKLPDESHKTWSLQDCLKWRYPLGADGVRVNVEFFIGLRNKIEHRYQDQLIPATAGQAHALVINYEAELVGAFSEEHSLGTQLRFPVFVQSLSPDGIKEQLALRRLLPKALKSYITKFTQSLDKKVRDSDTFDYRVMLVPMKGSKSEAELAMTFVRAEDLTAQKRAELERQGKVGTGVVIEKERNVMHSTEVRASDVVGQVQPHVPFVVNLWHVDQIAKHSKAKPGQGEPKDRTDIKYCVYVKPLQQYLYTTAFIKLCIDILGNRDRYKEVFTKSPITKVASLADKAESKAKANDGHVSVASPTSA